MEATTGKKLVTPLGGGKGDRATKGYRASKGTFAMQVAGKKRVTPLGGGKGGRATQGGIAMSQAVKNIDSRRRTSPAPAAPVHAVVALVDDATGLDLAQAQQAANGVPMLPFEE